MWFLSCWYPFKHKYICRYPGWFSLRLLLLRQLRLKRIAWAERLYFKNDVMMYNHFYHWTYSCCQNSWWPKMLVYSVFLQIYRWGISSQVKWLLTYYGMGTIKLYVETNICENTDSLSPIWSKVVRSDTWNSHSMAPRCFRMHVH